MRKIGKSAPCPTEYLELILLPRLDVVQKPVWKEMSRLDQHIFLLMLNQEAEPIEA